MLTIDLLKDGRQGCKIVGEVDVATASPFRDALEQAVDSGAKEIFLDISDMEYIDSTGIGILIDMKKNIMEPDQEFVLIHPKRSIAKLFQLTGVDQIFRIVEA
ncbi:MAG: STAS domain-containing protein [Eubacteriaceae bacterium]|jgi:anti-sigma B factor antagonist